MELELKQFLEIKTDKEKIQEDAKDLKCFFLNKGKKNDNLKFHKSEF